MSISLPTVRLLTTRRVTPNVVVKRYDENETGHRPGTDVHLRLSFFLDFE
jgi:hypothetical protein